MEYNEFFGGLKNRRAAVLGVGVSNRPLMKLLEVAGADVTALDRRYTGDGYLDALPDMGAELIFRSPGIKPFEPQIVEAVRRGAVLTSEMETFMELCPCPVYAVTGSDGKTTTTTILALLLERAGMKVFKGGNIGAPLLDRVPEMTAGDAAVLELSSFQLMTMRKSPHVAVVTNLSPNHLDWHRDMDEYIAAKMNIARFQMENDRLVMNYDNELSRITAEKFGLKPTWFTKEHPAIDPAGIKIKGAHNLENYLAAIAAAGDLVSEADVREVARTFGGVEHRMEFVAEIGGVSYYNDSIASSPTRTIAGLKTFDSKVILILGGKPKVPFDPLTEIVGDYARLVLTVGQASDEIEREFAGKVPVIPCGTVESAVCKAKELAVHGDAVLLSPACTSFDQFKNFEERGNLFKRLVRGEQYVE
ncbi:UDP-N-acetylmuramoylalanine--D-glutamate ligase [Clostridia bacterium]|nr:UDP-N-acetylmuramoylalanine--D-glutamate ligase [Clostridia bacterium]